MSTKQTEWTSIDLTKDVLDFTGATYAQIENTNREFISLTMRLRDGRMIRLRKTNYSVELETPLIPTVTKYVVRGGSNIELTYNSESEAESAAELIRDAVIEPVKIPIEKQLTSPL